MLVARWQCWYLIQIASNQQQMNNLFQINNSRVVTSKNYLLNSCVTEPRRGMFKWRIYVTWPDRVTSDNHMSSLLEQLSRTPSLIFDSDSVVICKGSISRCEDLNWTKLLRLLSFEFILSWTILVRKWNFAQTKPKKWCIQSEKHMEPACSSSFPCCIFLFSGWFVWLELAAIWKTGGKSICKFPNALLYW